MVRVARAAVVALTALALLACDDNTGPSVSTPQLPRIETAMALGALHTCALTASGKAYCWGKNNVGQLGDGSLNDHITPSLITAPASAVFVHISAANNYTCAVTAQHELYCWGAIPQGAASVATPQLLVGAPQVQAVSAGWFIGCALDLSNLAYCWGTNEVGQLGNGDSVAKAAPVAVNGGVKFRNITAGLKTTCGLTSGSQAFCWGNNAQRNTGVAGSPSAVIAPTAVQGGLAFTTLVTGATLSCGIVASSAGYCWGQSYFGSGGFGQASEFSISPPTTFVAPTQVGAMLFKQIVPGTGNDIYDSTCGLRADGTAFCWGMNSSGQLGISTSLPTACSDSGQLWQCTNTPLAVSTSEKFLWLASGAETVCGITTSHVLMCWGRNGAGQVGDGTTVNQLVPIVVAGGLVMP